MLIDVRLRRRFELTPTLALNNPLLNPVHTHDANYFPPAPMVGTVNVRFEPPDSLEHHPLERLEMPYGQYLHAEGKLGLDDEYIRRVLRPEHYAGAIADERDERSRRAERWTAGEPGVRQLWRIPHARLEELDLMGKQWPWTGTGTRPGAKLRTSAKPVAGARIWTGPRSRARQRTVAGAGAGICPSARSKSTTGAQPPSVADTCAGRSGTVPG